MRYGRQLLIALAVVAVALSLTNASWIASQPRGRLALVAEHGITQQYDRQAVRPGDCAASRIETPQHNYIDNSVRSLQDAGTVGADAVALDVHPTSDGRMVVFNEATLDCRTNGRGPIRARTLAELKALDIGHGYTADGGKTFPLRGRGIGGFATVEEALQVLFGRQIFFRFTSANPRDADLLAAAFARAGVAPSGKHAFLGDEPVLARIRALAPKAWIVSRADTARCAADYMKWGWSGFGFESCRAGTAIIPLDGQFFVWGWPKRFLARMASVDARVVMMGEADADGTPVGLKQAEQLGEVPRDFRGHVWVDDIYTVGRALR